MESRIIVLVGLPGAGKTRVGSELARRLDLPFVDADAEIERAASRSIAGIFADEGEAGFRTRERAAIATLLDGAPKVLALGGGAFTDDATRARILAEAVSFWLDVPEPELVARLERGSGRPLFDGNDVPTVLRQLSVERTPHYRQAHVQVAGRTSAEMVDAILAALGKPPPGG